MSTVQTPRCPTCGGATRERNGVKGRFYGCLRYPDCKGLVDAERHPVAQKKPLGQAEWQRAIAAANVLCGLLGTEAAEDMGPAELADTAVRLADAIIERVRK